jgi:hypothetical protein
VWMVCAGAAWLRSCPVLCGDVGRRRGGWRRRLAEVPLSRPIPPISPQVQSSFTSMHALWAFCVFLGCFKKTQFLTPARCRPAAGGVSSRAAAGGHRAAATFFAHARSLRLWGAAAIDPAVCGRQRAAFSVRRPGARRPSRAVASGCRHCIPSRHPASDPCITTMPVQFWGWGARGLDRLSNLCCARSPTQRCRGRAAAGRSAGRPVHGQQPGPLAVHGPPPTAWAGAGPRALFWVERVLPLGAGAGCRVGPPRAGPRPARAAERSPQSSELPVRAVPPAPVPVWSIAMLNPAAALASTYASPACTGGVGVPCPRGLDCFPGMPAGTPPDDWRW